MDHGDTGRKKGPEKIGRLLGEVLNEAAGERERRPESLAAVAAWPGLAGKRLAAVSRAVELRDGKLFVEVKAPVWKQELLLQKRNLIRKINDRLGNGLASDIVINVREYGNG